MTIKAALFGIVILLLLASGFVLTPQKKSPNLPPGVLPEMWIPLTENSGIALRDTSPMFDLHGKPVANGTLMVKAGGFWQRVYLDSAPEIMPVKP